MLFEIHCHSTYSDGIATPKEMVEYAKTFLDGIAITDHDAIGGSLEALRYVTSDFKVISGMEVSAAEGHILALDVRELIPRDLSAKETVERIHSLGGIAVAAHPYDLRRRGVGDLILKLPFDAVEAVNAHTFGNKRNPTKVCREAGLTMVGGSDAHCLGEMGDVAVEFEGDLITSVRDGKVSIRSKPLPYMILKHGMGIIRRRLL